MKLNKDFKRILKCAKFRKYTQELKSKQNLKKLYNGVIIYYLFKENSTCPGQFLIKNISKDIRKNLVFVISF